MKRMGNASEVAAPHGVFPCRAEAADGRERWVAIAVRDDAAWRAFVDVLGRPDWSVRPALAGAEGRLAAAEEIEREVAAWTSGQEASELAARLQAAGVEAGPVQDLLDLGHDPQLEHRGHFVRLEHGALGPLAFERRGYRLSHTPGGIRAPGPLLGEHTHAVLAKLLGLSDEEIAAADAAGITA